MFDPAYRIDAARALEAIVDEIEALVRGALHRTGTGKESDIALITDAKKAR